MKKGGNIDVPTIGALQLRFIDNRNYVIEVICNQFQSDPIVIKNYTLPLFVTKSPGSAGNGREMIEVRFKSRHLVGKKFWVLKNQELKTYTAGSVDLGITPISTCAGYGFQCC